MLSEGGSGSGLCTTPWFKGNVAGCIFKKQVLCLVVDGFQPLLRTEQGTKGVQNGEEVSPLLFLLTLLPACLAYPAELC